MRNEVEVGATFLSQSRGAFNQPSKTVWKVIALSGTANGLPHARLVSVSDHLSSRMVAVGACWTINCTGGQAKYIYRRGAARAFYGRVWRIPVGGSAGDGLLGQPGFSTIPKKRRQIPRS